MKIAIQGEAGSFHHLAAIRWSKKDDVNILACETFKEVFDNIKKYKADSGVVAIENSLFGSINEVYDLLYKNKIPIVGEILLPVNQCIIGKNDCKLTDIKNIYSHPVAIAQCRDYLDKYLPKAKRIENYDTAASVQFIKSLQGIHSAAIASPLAAKLNNMKIIKKGVQNHNLNFTRFLILQNTKQPVGNETKISIILQTSNQPGSLYKALKVFYQYGVNITKLQSRPIEGKPWKYMFYIDCLCKPDIFEKIKKDLEQIGNTILILGYYNEDN